MTETDKKFLKYWNDKSLWRRPSYSVLCKKMGYQSKNAVFKQIEKLKKLGKIK